MKSNLETLLLGRYWLMPDGELVPHIAGGSDDDGEPDDKDSVIADLQKQLKSARGDAAKNRTALREMEGRLDGFDPDEYAQLKAEAEAAAKQKEEDKGNYDKLLEESQRKHELALEKANNSTAQWKSRFEALVVDNQLLGAASKAVSPEAAVTLARSKFAFDVLDDGSVEIRKGEEVLYDDEGKALAPSVLMQQFLSDNPYLMPASKEGGSGGGAPENRAPAGDKSTDQKVKDGLTALLS